MTKYPLVKVTWLDAHGSAANVAYAIEEIPHAPVECVSHGLLLRQDEVGVSIASEVCDKDTFRGYSFVPASMLVSVEPVVKVRQRRKKKPVELAASEPPQEG